MCIDVMYFHKDNTKKNLLINKTTLDTKLSSKSNMNLSITRYSLVSKLLQQITKQCGKLLQEYDLLKSYIMSWIDTEHCTLLWFRQRIYNDSVYHC